MDLTSKPFEVLTIEMKYSNTFIQTHAFSNLSVSNSNPDVL